MQGNPQQDLNDKRIIDSGCSRHMTGNKSYLTNYKEIDGGFVAFGGNSKGKITGKGKIRAEEEPANFALMDFSSSSSSSNKEDKGVIDSECSRHMIGNMSYLSEFNELNGGYVAFGGNPNGGKITGKGKIRTATKDETSPILKTFIIGLENQLSLKVKVIRSDNRSEFKNYDLNQFCGMKGIKGEFSVPRTPQQNGIAERKNNTLIEAARTMLTDSLLPTPF
nr:putative ribonuclease H-like domain-containing protein [Tanacetum cinerariifolium]